MRLADADVVASLCDELGYPTTAASVGERIASLASRPDQILLVAEVDGIVVGWIHVQHAVVLESEPWADIGGLVVTASARGRGVGRALLAAGERWASEQGFDVLRVRSNVVRAGAHEFYRRCGYEVVKTQHTFCKVLDTRTR